MTEPHIQFWLDNPVVIYIHSTSTWFINTNPVPYSVMSAFNKADKFKFYISLGPNTATHVFTLDGGNPDFHLKTVVSKLDEEGAYNQTLFVDFDEVDIGKYLSADDHDYATIAIKESSDGTTNITLYHGGHAIVDVPPLDGHEVTTETKPVPHKKLAPIITSSKYPIITSSKYDIKIKPSGKHASNPCLEQPMEHYMPTPNPLVNADKLTQKQNTIKLEHPSDYPRDHQTLVVVYGSQNSSEKFKERARRLIGGLGMAETIKVDIATVCGGDFYVGLEFFAQPGEGTVDEEALKNLYSHYAQVVEVKDWNN